MPTQLIPTAEAAFIAGLTDRQMHRVVDEHLVPDALVGQQGNSRLFTRLGAAFAKFYFATEELLVAGARRQVLDELFARVVKLPIKDHVLTLVVLEGVNWKVERQTVIVDVMPYVLGAYARAMEVDQAAALVTTDPEVLGGTPVFAGTRLPLDVVLSSLAKGIDLERLRASYSFLTEAHVQAAKVYEQVHPRRGRPRRLSEMNPEVPRRVTRIARRTAA